MIHFKSVLKLTSVTVLTFVTVYIISIFVNYSFDLKEAQPLLDGYEAKAFYDALVVQTTMSIASSGFIMGAITLIVLLFSIGQFINEAGAELGVLKALGYSENRLALDFMKFGLSVLIGAITGYVFSAFTAQIFYTAFDPSCSLKVSVSYGFHFQTPMIMVIVPTAVFSLFAFIFARVRLAKKPLELIRGGQKSRVNKLTLKLQADARGYPFLKELKRNMLSSNLMLVFFIGFAAFSFSAGIQMAFMMSDVTESWLTPAVFVSLGLVLGAVTLLLALTFVMKNNSKYIAILKAYGYTESECSRAMFGGYRLVTYIGFALGTLYQYFIMKAMSGLFASDNGALQINFHVVGFFATLAIFLFTYEMIMLYYTKRLAKMSLKQIMQ